MPVNRGPFMEYLRARHTSTGVTVVTTAVETPISKTEELAMLIHEINLYCAEPNFTLATRNNQYLVVSKRSHEGDAALQGYGNQDCLHFRTLIAAEGIAAGTQRAEQQGEVQKRFDPPLLYSKSQIYIESLQSAAGMQDAQVECSIGYTLEKVSRDDFIDALVE